MLTAKQRAPTRVFGAIVSILTMIVPIEASAQSVDELLNRATEARSERTCVVPPDHIEGLVRRLAAGEGRQDQSRILSFLASQPNWRSTNHISALRVLNRISSQGDVITVSLVARALEKADGELLDILASGRSEENIEQSLRSLIRNNEGRNPVYAAFSKLALAELLQERAFREVSTTSLPISDLEERTTSIGTIEESIMLYFEASEKLSELRSSVGFGARNYQLDLPYLIALLRFVSGDDAWTEDLRSILQEEGDKDSYNAGADGRHILIERFLSPSLLFAPTSNADASCSGRRTVFQSSRELYSRDKVRRFFNPIQLANFTCNILQAGEPFDGLTTIVNDLEGFENRDYRVVLGHFRGDEVRFSFLQRAELVDLAEELAMGIEMVLDDPGISQFSSTCSEGVVEPMPRSVSLVGVQNTGSESGYIYIGSGLTLNEAEQLQSIVVEDKNLRDAYLIRPVID
ncbi:hypothetical protein [Litoreibacter halocynthiae]|uniref:hypothetical protein n=1 Tax=Litoreibacter halocynthiae TaxID=1242689 RepID=UPI002490FC1C|nr:hypothetical protein [Litoreibacter halocynthiae]